MQGFLVDAERGGKQQLLCFGNGVALDVFLRRETGGPSETEQLDEQHHLNGNPGNEFYKTIV